MVDNQILCEQEPIHLVGRIQGFGKSLILDADLTVVGISANFDAWLSTAVESFLEKNVIHLAQACFKEDWPPIEEFLQKNLNAPNIRETLEITLFGRLFDVCVYQQDAFIHLDFENKNKIFPNVIKLSSYSKKLNQSGERLWKSLCESIREIVGYDRVMVYQFLEDKSGQVIAESIKDGITSYFGFRFPEFDIPAQARRLYEKHHARQTADITAQTFPILSLRNTPFDLSFSNLRALSPIHLQYLANAGAQASLSFSIIVQDELWGMVTCQHSEARHVDYNERALALFLTEFAVNKHLAVVLEQDLELDREIAALEMKVKENILLKSNVLTGLAAALPDLAKLISADGIAVVHKDRNLLYNTGFNSQELDRLHSYINSLHDKPILKDHNFAFKHRDDIDIPLTFAGLCRLDIDLTRSFSLYAFRKEVIFEESWAGKPEKLMTYDETQHTYFPSPRQSFEAWKQAVYGTAPRWKTENILALKRIRQVVRESIVQKSDEISNLNQELIQLNNALDTYSYTVTHDLKNPLSSIKLSGQFLRLKANDNPLVVKSADNILHAVRDMEGMMDKILEFSKAKVYQFTPEWIDVANIIKNIVETGANRYVIPFESIIIERTLPIYGERSLLYQLFSNVIGNAIKYSSKELHPKIVIASTVNNNMVTYYITDNGIGIDNTELEKVYEVFKRMSNAAGFEGSGVGMAIVKRILERFNGQIDIRSKVGVGTTIAISFPNADIPAEWLNGTHLEEQ